MGAIEQVLERLDFAKNVQGPGDKVDGHARIAFFDAAHGAQGGTHALGQRRLREVAPPTRQRDVGTELVHGTLDRQGQRCVDFKSS